MPIDVDQPSGPVTTEDGGAVILCDGCGYDPEGAPLIDVRGSNICAVCNDRAEMLRGQFVAAGGNLRHADELCRTVLMDLHIDWPECGFYVGTGWLATVERALTTMVDAGWNRDLGQIKQKFCELRIYVGEETPDVRDIRVAAQTKCNTLCEVCGLPHGLSVPMSGRAYCTECLTAVGRILDGR